MPKITDVIKDLGITKKDFSSIYEDVVGKTLGKTTTLTEKQLSSIKSHIQNKKGGDSKVLKANELGSGGFLSGLGFNQQQPQSFVQDEEEQEDMVLITKKVEKDNHKVVEKKEKIKHDFIGDLLSGKKIEPQKTIITPLNQSSPAKTGYQGNNPKTGYQGNNPKTGYQGNNPKTGYQGNNPKTGYQGNNSKTGYQGNNSKTGYQGNNSNNKKSFPPRPGNQPYQKPAEHKHPVHQAPQFKKVEKIATTSANLVKKTTVVIDEKITVKEFSEKLGIPLPEVMKKLIENKIMVGLTASLDFDTAMLIAEELGVGVTKKENTLNVESFMAGDLQSILALDKDSDTKQSRPPIVTIMGHVDHGKTSLLDYLRKTTVVTGEAGGITQSIGASLVEHDGKKICFIDTPGHELFTSLRARGAKLTNLVVIVVAADDSVMPQTIESIGHAKDSGVPMIVAITKIDKPGKNVDQIKQDLAKYNVIPEDWGGDVPVIGVSSKTGQGIPELLEAILLHTEMLDLQFNPKRAAAGVVLDAHKDPKQGVVSTIIVMTGTLHVGDVIVSYNTYGKVRRMQNRKGQNIKDAPGGEPVQILGITELPEPGRLVEVVANEKEAQQRISIIQEQVKTNSPESAIQQFLTGLQSGAKEAELRLILKSDGSSSLEALKQAVGGLQLPKNVTIKVIHSDVGHFNDSDISLAQASGALLLGFNISINAILKKKAESLKIEMKSYDIIYELTDYLNKLLLGMVEIEKHEVTIGKMQVLGIFYTKGKEMVIGGKMTEGKVKNKLKFNLLRGDEILCQGTIVSLHRNKDEVKEVNEGEEFGLKVHVSKKIEINDVLEFLEMQEIKE